MPTITLTKKELKETVRESVREAIGLEMMKFRSLILPYVSEDEQKDIEQHFKKPERKVVKKRTITV